jgi:hypothetical protein
MPFSICPWIDLTLITAAGMMHDVDDTAKALQTLYLLGRPSTGPERLTSEFSDGLCFKPYEAERNPGPSANFNVLKALFYFRALTQRGGSSS